MGEEEGEGEIKIERLPLPSVPSHKGRGFQLNCLFLSQFLELSFNR